MIFQYVLLATFIGLSTAGHGINAGVDESIEHVEWNFSDKLCLDLLLVDCTKHVTNGDEQICGSDGNTYPNHCQFVHAVCEFHYSNYKLTVNNHGACMAMTAPTTAAPVMTTTLSGATMTTTMAPVSTTMGKPASTTMAPASATSTMASATTTTMAQSTASTPVITTPMVSATANIVTTTTTAGPTTTDAVHNIIQGVFCVNADAIDCSGSPMEFICASNGVLYPSQCEFAKANCKDANLTRVDVSKCPTP